MCAGRSAVRSPGWLPSCPAYPSAGQAASLFSRPKVSLHFTNTSHGLAQANGADKDDDSADDDAEQALDDARALVGGK